ncbi:MAG TPA: hypothetical protein PKC28_08250 [Bdellovibrionales bacterium]|nr:hypothetical protein [Bdellovibrionales bacterium]
MKYLMGILCFTAFGFSALADEVDLKTFPYNQTISKSSQKTTSGFPEEAIVLLRKHKVWQTNANFQTPDIAPMILSARKWSFDESSGKATLKELTRLAVERDCALQKNLRWKADQVTLGENFTAKRFLIAYDYCNPPNLESYTFTDLGNERFELSPPTGTGFSVIFFPSAHVSSPANPDAKEEVHVFTAPGGLQAVKHNEDMLGIKFERANFLHHDLKKFMPVVIDTSFPSRYISVLKTSFANWNRVLGVDYFRIQSSIETVDVRECYTARKLCVLWNGVADISWSGIGGTTQITFDPQTGEILGGYIGFSNTLADNLIPTPASPEVDNYLREDIGVDNVAKIFLRRNEFMTYLHPKPEWTLGFVFIHEIGHFNGLKHNFSGSREADAFFASKTVMDYSPFSARNSKSMELGSFDIEAIRLVYNHQKLSSEYTFCGDFDANVDGVSSDPNCNQWDLGSPEKWFVRLSELATHGVFEKHPRLKDGILLDYLSAFLEPNKPTVTPAQVGVVESFLCRDYSNEPKVFDYLLKEHKVVLACQP